MATKLQNNIAIQTKEERREDINQGLIELTRQLEELQKQLKVVLDKIDQETTVSAAESDADYDEIFNGHQRASTIEVDNVDAKEKKIVTKTIKLKNTGTRVETKAAKQLSEQAQKLRDQIFLTNALIQQKSEGSTLKILTTKSFEAPGPVDAIKSTSSKPHVKNRVKKEKDKVSFTTTFNPKTIFTDPVWEKVKPKGVLDYSSDSGHSSQSSEGIDNMYKVTPPPDEYQPKIVSVEHLPTWDEVTKKMPDAEVPFTKLTEVIATSVGTSWFTPIFGSSTTLFISSLTTSLLAVGTSMMTLRESSTISKILSITTIVSSLITFIVTLGHLFSDNGVKFNSEKVIEQIPKLAESFDSETKANSLAWIYPAITSVIAIIVGGLTTFNICDIKSVIQKGMLIRSTEHVANLAKSVTKFLFEDLLHLDLTGDQEAHLELHKWAKRSAELAVLPYLDFLKDRALLLELNTAVDKTLPVITHKYESKTLSITSKTAYSLILQNMQRLIDKLAAIKIILSAVKRQETLGVLFSGEASVGKSSLSVYCARKMAEKLGYSPELYNMNMSRKDGYYGPYGGQDFGTIDEFMALRKEDPNLPQLNQILSGDHFNLEAAHLEGKNQPSALKCVFLTSNNICPSIVSVLDIAAAQATWDRILRFEVIDPLVKGRQGINSHRKPDFSHLRFRFVVNTRELTSTNIRYQEITIDEVLGMIMFQIAKRELNFIKQHSLTSALESEKEQLMARTSFLEKINVKNQANNGGQVFKVVRIQGPLKTGKTRLANKIAHKITQSYIGWKVFNVENFVETPKKRGVYIIDDCLTPNKETYETFLKWINHGHEDNQYIIATNHIINKNINNKQRIKNWWFKSDNFEWMVNTYGASSGIARRLGLFGNIITEYNDKVLMGSEAVTIELNQRGHYILNNQEMTEQEVLSYIYRTFQANVIDRNEVIQVNETFSTAMEYDATVLCDDIQSLKKVFSSKSRIVASCCSKNNGVSIKFTPSLFSKAVQSFNDASDLMPGNINNDDDLVANALNIATILNDVMPGVSCKLYIVDVQREIILHDRRLYIGILQDLGLNVQHHPNEMQISYSWQNRTHSFSYEQYNMFVERGHLASGLHLLPSECVAQIHEYVKSNIGNTNPMFNYHKMNATMNKLYHDYKSKTIKDFIKDHKALSIIIGLVGVVSIASITTLFVKMFNGDPPVTSNSAGGAADDDEYADECIKDHATTYRREMMNGNYEGARQAKQAAYDAGKKKEWDRWENDFRSRSMDVRTEFNKAIAEANIERLNFLINTYGKELEESLKNVKGNNITLSEEIHQEKSLLEVIKDRIQNNAVKVTSKGAVYGIGLFGRCLVTVSHIFVDENAQVTVQSNGVEYKARVVRLSRRRDLAMLIVEDVRFPPFKDITSMLMNEQEFHLIRNAYFIRSTTTPLIISASVSFISNVASPKRDSTNPLYALDSQFWMFDLIGISDVNKIFKSGDCGLPIITMFNNQPKLIGVHNAIHTAGYAWFTSLCIEDLKQIKANSICSTVVHQISMKHMTVDNKTKSALLSDITSSVYDRVSPLKIFGYSRALHYYSNPEVKKIKIDKAEKYLGQCPKIPAAITMENVKDDSDLYRDRKNRINPLFAQAVKYAEKLPTINTYDVKVDDYVTRIIKAYYDINYKAGDDLKLHEVINGCGNLKGIEMDTSAGPKFKKHFRIMTKRPTHNPNVLFVNKNADGEKPFYVINKETSAGKELEHDYHMYMSSIKQGVAPLIISKDNAKVELLPRHKVEKGKVRLFNELDLTLNMVLKTFFGPMLDKVIAKHETEIFCIGTNPFVDATAHMMYFNAIEGEFLNADFKALDKTTPRCLIYDFVECALRHHPVDVRSAIAEMLTYRLHTLDGNLYFIDCGNCSGSYVTTLMNCHTVLKVSWYSFCKKWLETYNVLPTYKEIMDNCVIRILGDDAIRKISNVISITNEDLVSDAATYGLTQTPSKTEGLVSFCSRTYIEIEPMIYFPKLSKDSVTSILFWYNKLTKPQIQANIFTALLEASLHDETYYNACWSAAVDICGMFNVPFDFIPYKEARETFVAYIRGYRSSPVFKEQENLLSQRNKNVSNSVSLFNKMADMWLNEYTQKRGLKPAKFEFDADGLEHTLEWTCVAKIVIADETYSGAGIAYTKKEAKRDACEQLKTMLDHEVKGRIIVDGKCVRELDIETAALLEKLSLKGQKIVIEVDSSSVKSNADICCGEYHTNECATVTSYTKSRFNKWLRKQHPSILRISQIDFIKLWSVRCIRIVNDEIEYHKKMFIASLNSQYNEYKLLGHKLHIDRPLENVRSNADMPVEPASMNQAATSMAIGTLPSNTNPQPTGVMPAMTSAGEDIMANLQFAEHQVLQPVGAPNMLAVGAITFDIKHLIYEQFLDADIEFEVTDDLPSGSIIFQIPYGVNTPWVNSYIKNYARLHGRYAGAIQYRITVIGNPLFSGAISVAWAPQKVSGSTMLVSESQKYAYSAKGVTMPWNVIHTLHDGRQNLFWRKTDEVMDDDRPHLVVMLMMSLQNPMREGGKTRIRVASKLCNAVDPNPFVFSDPVPYRELPTATNNSLQPAAFDDMFINARNTKINIYTDGTYASEQRFNDEQYPEYSSRATKMSSARTRVGVDDLLTTETSIMYGPAQSVIHTWAYYQSDWPIFAQLISNLSAGTFTQGKGVVSILANHNMDWKSFSTLAQANPWGGSGGGTAKLTQNNWEAARNRGAWHAGTLNRDNAQVKILAAVYNNQSFNMRTTVHGGKPNYLMCGGYIKLITDKGTAIFFLTSFVTNTDIGSPLTIVDVMHRCGLSYESTIENGLSVPTYPYLNIDEQIAFTDAVNSLPLGYQALRITDIPPSAVLIEGYPGQTASDNATITKWFQSKARDLDATKCLQFRLVDAISVRTIATVRYLQELNQFVINTMSLNAYRVLPILTENILVQSIIITNRTNDFAITDTILWYDRAASFTTNVNFVTTVSEEWTRDSRFALLHQDIEDDQCRCNAMMAALAVGGGAMQGIGQGLSAIGERKYQEKMQSNQFGHEETMQGNMFNFSKEMQTNNFDFQKMMQQGNFGQEQLMQERGYQNDLGLLQSSHQEQRITDQSKTQAQSQARMTERGLSSKVKFLTNPGASVA